MSLKYFSSNLILCGFITDILNICAGRRMILKNYFRQNDSFLAHLSTRAQGELLLSVRRAASTIYFESLLLLHLFAN